MGDIFLGVFFIISKKNLSIEYLGYNNGIWEYSDIFFS